MNNVWQEIEQLLIHKDRVIGQITGPEPGPAIAFCAGIHGNEPSGVVALKNVFGSIESMKLKIRGKIIGFIGNRNALHNKTRFMAQDLNRIWTSENIVKLHQKGFEQSEIDPEALEMIHIDTLLQEFILHINGQNRYFVDLHTTSSPSVPFAAIDKIPKSYDFAMQLPIPFVSNLDDFLKGTLIHYLDHIKFSALVFEAGMHDDPASVAKHEAFIWLVLGLSGAIEISQIPNYEGSFTLLKGLSEHPHKIFRILYRHHIDDDSHFEMIPGLINFQGIEEGMLLAREDEKDVLAPISGNIFMPLYQEKGADGFFIIERVDDHVE